MRPASTTGCGSASSCSRVQPPNCSTMSAALCCGTKSFGNAMPFVRIAASLARRSAMILLSSAASVAGSVPGWTCCCSWSLVLMSVSI